MSWEGSVIGVPFCGFRMLCDASISNCASRIAALLKWHVHRHLVTVKVGVERSTYQRVKLNRLSFDQFGLESLDTQAGAALEHG